MGVEVVLRCDACGTEQRPRVPMRGARLGGVRLHVSSDWYVDGGTVACAGCTTPEQTERIFRETWHESDLKDAADELGITIRRVKVVEEEWAWKVVD